MQGTVILSPLVSWPLLFGAGVLVVLIVAFAVWRGLGGWWLRGVAFFCAADGAGKPVIATGKPHFFRRYRCIACGPYCKSGHF